MKLDRRSFLSLGVGAAAGTALSPLPWKLMDDSSIWSQNWPWTPVPQIGEVTLENSVCTLCPGRCGITVRKIAGRLVKVEGRDGFPVNDGGVCLLGLSGPQMIYGPARVKTPMKKNGQGKWVSISWDEALSTLAGKLTTLRENEKTHQLACVTDTDQGSRSALFARFLNAFGSPNFLKTTSSEDAYNQVLSLAHGVDAVPGFDLENTDYLLSLGTGFIDGWGSPVRNFMANNHTTLAQVDSRLSNTAAAADEILAALPGTEGFIALGVAHVILKEGLAKIDPAAVEGFDAWSKIVLDRFSAADVARFTGVEEGKIVKVARAFAKSKAPLAICGKGRGTKAGSSFEFMATHALNALVGSVNAKGGIFVNPAPSYLEWEEVSLDEVAESGVKQENVGGAGSLAYKMFAAVNEATDSPVELLLVAGGNPCYTLSDTENVKKAFQKIPYKVCFSTYMDETAEMADLVLPEHSHLERFEDAPLAYGSARPGIALSRPVTDRNLFDSKYAGDILIELAGALGEEVSGAFPWESYEACLEETLGDKWDGLLEEGLWVNEDVEPEGASFDFTKAVSDAMFTLVKAEGVKKLTLVPVDSMRIPAGALAAPPFAVKTISDKVLKDKNLLVEVNPSDAKKLRLKDGGKATLKTPAGKALVEVFVNPGIMSGVVGMPTGLGHTAFDDYIRGKGINFNAMIKPVEDPVTGFDVAWGIGVELSRA